MRRLLAAIVVASWTCCVPVWAQGQPATAPETGAAASSKLLRDLPSPPGSHIEKIKALGDDSWLALGRPAPDPRWGPAPGRSYTDKMAFAPDLRGAFLFGEGVHGASGVGPRAGHYNDDLFFYDINAHAWLCVYPGTDLARLNMKLDANGFEVDPDGQHLPVAIAVHGYECLTYDSDRRQFMTLETGSPYWGGTKEFKARRLTWLADKPSGRALSKNPFFFDVAANRWQRRKVEGDGPTGHFCKSLVYVPSLKKTYYYGRRDDFWVYDNQAGKWAAVKGEGEPFAKSGNEGVLCHDTRRDRFYVFNEGQASIPWVYDLKANAWSNPQAANQPCPGDDYEKGRRVLSSTSGGVHYDAVNDVVVLPLTIKQGTGDPRNIPAKRVGLAIYDVRANKWLERITPLPEGMPRKSWNTFYDPQLNAHFYHLAGDSRPDGEIWVYRYRRGPAPASGPNAP